MSLILFYAINVINVFMCQSGQRYVHTLVRLLKFVNKNKLMIWPLPFSCERFDMIWVDIFENSLQNG